MKKIWVGCVWMVPVVLWSGGCAHVARSGSMSSLSLEAYLPLAVGHCWTYATSFQGQPQPDLKVCIVRKEKGYFVDDRPTPSRLRFDSEGLRDGKVRYLLKAPLEAGRKWMSVADVRTVEHFEILAVDKKARVPAGVYAGCVVVRMEVRLTPERSMVNRMTFAPQVGIVQIQADLKVGAQIVPQSRMVLKAFQKAAS